MDKSIDVVRWVYEASSRGDVPAILASVANEVDWEFVGSSKLPYAGRQKNHKEVADFFAAVAQSDDIHVFEPREFIEGGEHITVLGWEETTTRDSKIHSDSEWAHVFTVKGGRDSDPIDAKRGQVHPCWSHRNEAMRPLKCENLDRQKPYHCFFIQSSTCLRAASLSRP